MFGISNPFKQKEIGIMPFLSYKTKASRINNPSTFFERSVFFNKALEKRASVVGSVQFWAYKGDKEDEKTQYILDRPNNLLSGDDFWYLAQLYYDLYGAYYVWKETGGTMANPKITELTMLDPTSMQMKFDEYGRISHFLKDNRTRYEPDEIIFEYRPDPIDYRKPVSILNEGAKDVLRTEIELRDYQKKIAGSGGRINGVFSFNTEKGLTREQIREAKKNYQEHVNEANESGEGQIPMFLGGNASFLDLNRSPQEIQYLQSQQAVMEEVATITGVPKTILSSFDDIKFSNAKEARTTFLSETINPLIKKRVATLNQYLAPEGTTIEVEDMIPEDIEEVLKKLETANTINAMTLNEKREELGLDPLPNGDDILIPMNLVKYE